MARSRSRAVAATRTRTVVVREPRARRRSGERGSRGLSLAILAAGVVGATSILQAYQSGGPQGAFYALSAGYTGYQPWDKTWRPFNQWTTKMLWPLAAAFVVHAVAQRTGINRMVRRYLPVAI